MKVGLLLNLSNIETAAVVLNFHKSTAESFQKITKCFGVPHFGSLFLFPTASKNTLRGNFFESLLSTVIL